MGFSIIIPVKEINHYIVSCVPITLELDYPDFEVLIVPNELPVGDLPEFLRDPRIRLIASGRVSPAVKRDLGAAASRHEFLAFLDDDAYPAKDWLLVAERYFRKEGVEALGGPAMTPVGSSLGEQASGLFYETKVGGGGLVFRYRPVGQPSLVDDYPTVNLLVSKAAFNKVGGFDNDYWPGEDTKFCLDLVKAGGRILYVPELLVWHHRRALLRPHLRQVGGYGRHRGYFVKAFPETSLRVTYFAPSLFLLGNIAGALLSIWSSTLLFAWMSLLSCYLLACLVDSYLRARKVALSLLTTVVILSSHLTYGWMFIRGLCSSSHFKSQLR